MSEPSVLTATRLEFEYVGPATKKAKGWAVTDEAQQLVATVPPTDGILDRDPRVPARRPRGQPAGGGRPR